MTTTLIEWFGDVRVELEPNPDRPGMSCFLYTQADDYDEHHGSEYYGSLQLCEDLGGIPYDQGGPADGPQIYSLSPDLLQEIENWAVENGY